VLPQPPEVPLPATRPFAAKRVDRAGKWSKPFKGKPWTKVKLARKTLADQVWEVRAAQVLLARGCGGGGGAPTERTYWLIVARSVATGEVKYFVSNAPPKTALTTLPKAEFTRAGVEHVFRLAKTEVGFAHFEGRSYRGLMRHMTLCQLTLLFAAEQTDRLRGEKSRRDDRADRARALNTLCRLWLERHCKRSRVEHVASVIQHHQARNNAATQSRQRTSPKRE
jgi:SRSO17 transposase